ncbi:MAG: D-TA family PLP-dependent enzyme [Anaerolineae bacterium]|nr:D-TA family PLP-dependent enzyme [Anaerolineae bacterium]MDW8100286.1 D-TA family PLP-dependent enzyme [Anaerolineae bacterium]
MHRDDLDTPALTVDLDIMEDNIRRLQSYCDAHGLRLRPHIKTHKVPAIAYRQMRAGAQGIACQKLSEAEVFVAAGFDDILIPYNIVGPAKLERLARLMRQCHLIVAADSATTVHGLAQAAAIAGKPLDVILELEGEIQRTGIPTPEEAVTLARLIAKTPGLRYRGVMTYPSSPESAPRLQRFLEALTDAGLPPEIVSGGGTGAAYRSHEVPGLTEIRVGTYVYNDWTTVQRGLCTIEQCAQRVICTVVSRPTSDRAILDGGSKTFSNDGTFPMGHIVEHPEAVIYRLDEEHGYVDVSRCARKPEVGERVTVIPNHACAVTNLHDVVYGLRKDQVETIWPILARGKIT